MPTHAKGLIALHLCRSNSLGSKELPVDPMRQATKPVPEEIAVSQLVSIGLPVFNGEKYLEQAIIALCAQSYENLEIIISDNGSTDGTAEIVERHQKLDPRIRFFRYATNRGAAWNYNNTVHQASGEYFKWAAHDDCCGTEFISRCVAILDRFADVVLAYPGTSLIDAEGRLIGDYEDAIDLPQEDPARRFQSFMGRRSGECNAIFGLMRIDVLRQTRLIGPYPASDDVLLAEMSLRGKIVQCPERLFFRRDHPMTSLRANPDAASLTGWFDTARKGAPGLPTWRRLFEYRAVTRRVPLTRAQSLRCKMVLLRRVLAYRRALPAEAARWLGQLSIGWIGVAGYLVHGRKRALGRKRTLGPGNKL
jgi:hypothetical protein